MLTLLFHNHTSSQVKFTVNCHVVSTESKDKKHTAKLEFLLLCNVAEYVVIAVAT